MKISEVYCTTDTPDGRHTFIWLMISEKWIHWTFRTWAQLRDDLMNEDYA